MKIEKVCRYICATSGNPAEISPAGPRIVLLSLPRVRWLEKDNKPNKYFLEEELPSLPSKEYELENDLDSPLTEKEEHLLQLSLKGFSYGAIAERLDLTLTSIPQALSKARKKLERRKRCKSISP